MNRCCACRHSSIDPTLQASKPLRVHDCQTRKLQMLRRPGVIHGIHLTGMPWQLNASSAFCVEVPNSPTPSRTPRRTLHRHRAFENHREHERLARLHMLSPLCHPFKRILVLDAAYARIDTPAAFSTVLRVNVHVISASCVTPLPQRATVTAIVVTPCIQSLVYDSPVWACSRCRAEAGFSLPEPNSDRKWRRGWLPRACCRGVTQTVTSLAVHHYESPRDRICRLFRLIFSSLT